MSSFFTNIKFLIPFSTLLLSVGSVAYLNRQGAKPKESLDVTLVPVHLKIIIAILVAMLSLMALYADLKLSLR